MLLTLVPVWNSTQNSSLRYQKGSNKQHSWLDACFPLFINLLPSPPTYYSLTATQEEPYEKKLMILILYLNK